MDELRQRLLDLEKRLYCSADPQDKTDLELIINCLDALYSSLEESKNHKHTVI